MNCTKMTMRQMCIYRSAGLSSWILAEGVHSMTSFFWEVTENPCLDAHINLLVQRGQSSVLDVSFCSECASPVVCVLEPTFTFLIHQALEEGWGLEND
jgi:hypothetical protein